MPRTALLIRCDTDDADRIRTEAEKERRTISAYVLQNVNKMLDVDDRLGAIGNSQELRRVLGKEPGTGPRTAILVRCDDVDAERIRDGAKRRAVALNTFVIQSLKRAWKV